MFFYFFIMSKYIDKYFLKEKIKEEICRIATELPQDIKDYFNNILGRTSGLSKKVIEILIENYKIAESERIPLCQDTGIVLFFIEIGKDVYIDFNIEDVLNQSVKEAYIECHLRKSVVKDPINRVNTRDNTPAIFYYKFNSESKGLTIKIMLKGAGSENTAVFKMFTPTSSWEDIEDFIIDVVKNKAINSCPPVIVGIGIGGTAEKAMLMAKEALFRNIGERNKIEFYRDKEIELIEKLNELDIGPMGVGGYPTVIDVFIETYASHIASLSVAVNFNCHSVRHTIINF